MANKSRVANFSRHSNISKKAFVPQNKLGRPNHAHRQVSTNPWDSSHAHYAVETENKFSILANLDNHNVQNFGNSNLQYDEMHGRKSAPGTLHSICSHKFSESLGNIRPYPYFTL